MTTCKDCGGSGCLFGCNGDCPRCKGRGAIEKAAVGDMVRIKIVVGSVPPKETRVTGKITRIMPNGDVEVKTQGNGYHVVNPDKLLPSHGD